jgi:hypothetical protein
VRVALRKDRIEFSLGFDFRPVDGRFAKPNMDTPFGRQSKIYRPHLRERFAYPKPVTVGIQPTTSVQIVRKSAYETS